MLTLAEPRTVDEAAVRGEPDPPVPAVRTLPTWPVLALFYGFPLWWALGLGVLIFAVLAVPMAYLLHRRGDVRVPPLFGWWLVFVGWQAWGLLTLGVNDPTVYLPGSAVGRFPAWTLRTGCLVAVSVLALYLWNMDKRKFGPKRLLKCLAFLCAVTIVGGYLGTLVPSLQFTSPMELLVPAGIRQQAYVRSLIHPAVAQATDVLGYAAARPKAPFEYTNTWGNNLAVLVVLLLPWAAGGSVRRKLAAGAMAVLAIVPIVLSLNRGVWMGLALAVIILAVTFARQGKPLAAFGVAASTLLLAVAISVTPLGNVLTERSESGHSDATRTNIAEGSMEVAFGSPVIGLGAPRTGNGGSASIGAGRSPECPQCATVIYGSNGFLWTALVTTGVVGSLIYVGWLGAILWRSRRFRGVLATCARTVVFLFLFFSLFYDHVPSPIAILWTAIILLWWSQEKPSRRATRSLGVTRSALTP